MTGNMVFYLTWLLQAPHHTILQKSPNKCMHRPFSTTQTLFVRLTGEKMMTSKLHSVPLPPCLPLSLPCACQEPDSLSYSAAYWLSGPAVINGEQQVRRWGTNAQTGRVKKKGDALYQEGSASVCEEHLWLEILIRLGGPETPQTS